MRTVRPLALAAAALALLAAPDAAAQQEPVAIGDFVYAALQDDSTMADRGLLATRGARDGHRQPSLVWRCMEDGLNVMYDWDKYFIGNAESGADVRFRFDRDAWSEVRSWHISTDHAAGFLPLELVPVFTQAATASGTVDLVVTDSDGERLADTFPLGALAEGLARLACAR